ncbi:MAG TPA: exodeoxyribonuclease V subunit alpha [Nocardioidaceae bacterium]|nr:exodeoxyribonuclease V subunit alpha [Nocardioidaceae bacterium]
MTDTALAVGATGMLRDFNRAGVLSAADVHVARRISALAGENDQRALLAAALLTRAVRHGSVCLDLAAVVEAVALPPGLAWPDLPGWVAAVTGSPLVDRGVLRWEFDRLYLDRYCRQEAQVCADLTVRDAGPQPVVDGSLLGSGIARVFPDPGYDEQAHASCAAATRWTSVLTGGPGTGKTATVARLLALLAEQVPGSAAPGGSRERLRVALTAPTGKAAARLEEAVREATAELHPEDRDRLGTLTASTLHRLLGYRHENRTRFRHHRGNRLPHDVVVVDETSMVSLTMMARLVEAVRPDARLILVGDPDQLASVDAGAVLADLVAGYAGRPDSPVSTLMTPHRFGGAIAELAAAIRTGSGDEAVGVLRSGDADVTLVEDPDPAPLLHASLRDEALAVREAALAGDASAAIEALGRHRLLCAHRAGPYGVAHWNRQVEHWISEATGDPLYEPMYVGRPLLVSANDHGLGVYNGDTGVVVRSGDAVRAVVTGASGLLDLAPGRLGDVETMHAMTIHKSQGSQAEEVTVLLPPPGSRLLTRELLYTAVTRAQRRVRVVGSETALREALARRAQRASGLRQRLAAQQPH